MDHHADTRSDASLVALVLAGERETFGPLLLRYYASLARLCQRLLGPTPEAQDVAQEAALQAFLRLGELREQARFGAWLHAIAANLARMELRRRRILSLDALPDGAAMIVLWAAGPHTPEEVHAAREVHDTIVAALSELSEVNREVVIGFYLEGTQPHRPMTHDLALRLIEPLGGMVQRVVINRIADSTFFAEITLVANGQTHIIDARPSDAIALAARNSASIYVARSVFDTAGTTALEERLTQDEQQLASTDPAMARSASGERTWVLSLEARMEPAGSNIFPLVHFTSTDWPGVSYQRDIEWEGRQMMAIQLPGADENAAWLIAAPTLWDRIPATVMRWLPDVPSQPAEGEA